MVDSGVVVGVVVTVAVAKGVVTGASVTGVAVAITGGVVATGPTVAVTIALFVAVGNTVCVAGAVPNKISSHSGGIVTSFSPSADSPASGVPMPSVVAGAVALADGVGEGPTASEGVLLAGGGFSVTEESEQPQNNAPASKHTSKKARPSKNVFRFFKLFKLFKIYTSPNKKLRV